MGEFDVDEFSMQYLEKYLSPIRTSYRKRPLSEPVSGDSLMDKIRAQKVCLLEKRPATPDAEIVRREIRESWTRSFDYGLDPYHYNYPPLMSKEAFGRRLQEKSFFLQAAQPYMNQFDAMLSDMKSYLFLTDEKGVILQTSNRIENNRFWLTPGAVWCEQTTGTCSHWMCITLKQPIQICGPEHFSQIFKNVSCSSAPVFDACGNLEGTLTISSPYLNNQSSHSLGLVVSIASAIQKEFQLAEEKALLNVALSSINDVVIVMNQYGLIVTANAFARRLLEEADDESIRLENMLLNLPLVGTVMDTGVPILNTDVNVKIGKQKMRLCSIHPVKNHNGSNIGCVLTFRPVVNSGAIALRSYGPSVSTRFSFDKIVGSSPKTLQTIGLARKFSKFNNNILIEGESGTGKEVYAQSIHHGQLQAGPFIAVNCAAIPGSLIESELFGYEAGAFTGAERRGKTGKIELANNGTLFLDEIGDMPLELQAVLLRVLEDKLIMRLGGNRYIPVDFRLIAATNMDLLELVRQKKFREDLYYRLSVFRLDIAPLRERKGDIAQLAEHFLHSVARANRIEKPLLSHAARFILLQYHWPGNVRQLQNVISYAACMCEGGSIQPEHLPGEVREHQNAGLEMGCEPVPVKCAGGHAVRDDSLSMREVERMAIRKALDESKSIREAAKMLGIGKSTMYRKIKEYGISMY